jgi:hypothetical protein
MHDHRLPRHDRPPEPWLPHPGTPEPSSPAPMQLPGADWVASPMPRPGAGGVPEPLPALSADASAFARFVHGTVAGRKSIPLAVGLSLLGPLGLFYVSFLNGLAALIIVSYVARTIGLGLAHTFGGGPDAAFRIGLVVCWMITVPWAVIAARRHNARRAVA